LALKARGTGSSRATTSSRRRSCGRDERLAPASGPRPGRRQSGRKTGRVLNARASKGLQHSLRATATGRTRPRAGPPSSVNPMRASATTSPSPRRGGGAHLLQIPSPAGANGCPSRSGGAQPQLRRVAGEESCTKRGDGGVGAPRKRPAAGRHTRELVADVQFLW